MHISCNHSRAAFRSVQTFGPPVATAFCGFRQIECSLYAAGRFEFRTGRAANTLSQMLNIIRLAVLELWQLYSVTLAMLVAVSAYVPYDITLSKDRGQKQPYI